MNHFSNVMVFGASGVIGGAIAAEFGRRGWTVGVHYHQHQSAAQEVAATIQRAGGKGVIYQANVTQPPRIRGIIEDYLCSHSALHVLIWAVGVSSSKLLVQTPIDIWRRTLQTNLTGAFHVLQAIAPVFAKQQEGTAILVGSLAGEQGLAGQSAYAASKAGLIGLMRTAAREWGSSNIRINVVFPGWHFSPLSESGWHTARNSGTHLLHQSPTLTTMALSVYHLAVSPDISGQVWNLDSRIW